MHAAVEVAVENLVQRQQRLHWRERPEPAVRGVLAGPQDVVLAAELQDPATQAVYHVGRLRASMVSRTQVRLAPDVLRVPLRLGIPGSPSEEMGGHGPIQSPTR
eukprot:5180769-Heterocapsa_arctica.AAC.1